MYLISLFKMETLSNCKMDYCKLYTVKVARVCGPRFEIEEMGNNIPKHEYKRSFELFVVSCNS